MNKILSNYLIIFFLCLGFLSFGNFAFARDIQDITDWYIKDFQTNITVNKDSSLLITENITADCGDLPGKHGIFRVLPIETKTEKGIFKTPIELIGITDFDGKPYHYQAINDLFNHTITWKIGDANVTVTGVNYYRIVYRVKNAIRFGNKDFDELYWNLLGNYWDIGTDNFSAKIIFPAEVTSQNAKVYYYTGAFGSKDNSLATYNWDGNNVLNFNSTSSFQPGEGVTASITFPKDIFTPYVPSFWEKYGDIFGYLFFMIPLAIFIFAFAKWKKYGKDPKMKKPIPPEFGIPEDISPIQMGTVLSHGSWKNKFLSAAIVNLAVKKIIVIEQTETKILFFNTKDIVLRKNKENYDLTKVTPTEKTILDALFTGNILSGNPVELEKKLIGDLFKKGFKGMSEDIRDEVQQSKQDSGSINLSDLKNSFYVNLPEIQKSAEDDAVSKGWIDGNGKKYMATFIGLGIFLMFASPFSIFFLSFKLFLSIFISGIILIIFGLIMPKRTQAGVDLLFKIKGFELYMKQAENYRQQFYEKENIFDKFLPYAMIFGIAELWAKKMQLIYGEDYFKNYHPIWLVGTGFGNFDVNSFTSQLNSISQSISSSTGGSSGSGGGGSSGGGGGGGGGGGW